MSSEYPISEFPISETIAVGYAIDQAIVFTQTVGIQRTAYQGLFDFIELEQTLVGFNSPVVTNNLILYQEVELVVGVNTQLSDLILFGQSAVYQHDKYRTASDSLYFAQSVALTKSVHSIIDTIVFDDEVLISSKKLGHTIEHTIVFAQDLNTIAFDIEDVIEFSDTADNNFKIHVITHTLNLSQTHLVVRRILEPVFTQQIVFSQSVRSNIQAYALTQSMNFADNVVNHWVVVSANNTLVFTHLIAAFSPINVHIEDVLDFVQVARQNYTYADFEHPIDFNQDLKLIRSFYVDFCHCLDITDKLYRIKEYSISQSVTFAQIMNNPMFQTLVLTHSVVHNAIVVCCEFVKVPNKAGGSRFTMGQSVGLVKSMVRSHSDSLTFRHTVIYRKA